MKFATLVWHEVRTQRNLWIAAGAAALFSLVSPLIIRVSGFTAAEIRMAVGSLIAFLLAFLAALFLGAGAVGRDLSEQRMSFYLTRPIPIPTLWLAKIVGALVTFLGIGLLPPLPAVLFFADPLDRLRALFAKDASILYLAAFFVAAFFVAHLFSIAFRARSALLGLDLLLWLTALFILFSVGRHLLLAGFLTAVRWHAQFFGLAFLLAVLVSGWVALARGRVDPRRVYHNQLVTLWSILAVAIGAITVHAQWLLHPSFQDLQEISHVEVSPAGDWLLVSGRVRGRSAVQATFFWNPAQNRSHLNPLETGAASFVAAPEGNVILRYHKVQFLRWSSATLARLDLSGPRLRAKELLSLRPADPYEGFDVYLSPAYPNDHLLAIWRYDRLLVYRLEDMAIQAVRRISPHEIAFLSVQFLGPHRIRVYAKTPFWVWDESIPELFVFDLDIKSNRWTRICRLPSPLGRGYSIWFKAVPDQPRVLLTSRSDLHMRWDLVDVVQCKLLDTLLVQTRADIMHTWSPEGTVRFLPDGRVLRYIEHGSGKRVDLYDPRGRLQRTIPLDISESIRPACALDRAKVVLDLSPRENPRPRTSALLDLDTGRVHRLPDLGRPAENMAHKPGCPRLKQPNSGYVFYRSDRIDILNPARLSIQTLYRVPASR